MEPRDDVQPPIAMTRRRWALAVLVVLLTALGAGVGYAISAAMTPVYRGTASLLVGDFEDGNVSNNEILAMQSLTQTYADIARRQPVLARAAEDLDTGTTWQQLRAQADIRVPKESPQVVEISVEGTSRTWAMQAAGAIASHLVGFVDQTSGGSDFVSPQLRRLEQAIEDDQKLVDSLRAQQRSATASKAAELERGIERTQQQIAAWQDNYAAFKQMAATSSHVAIRPLGPADSPRGPVRPDTRFNTVVAGFGGLVLALAFAYLLESRRRQPGSTTVRTIPYPIVVPPNLSLTIPRNGHNVRHAGTWDRPADHHEGDVR